MGALLLISMFLLSRQSAELVSNMNADKPGDKDRTIVIDVGHGGVDPGKIGINGALEKDINLEIARILKGFFEANDIHVILTRSGDHGLYNEGDSNKKVQDMKRRLAVIEESSPDMVISIHQNAYTKEYVRGAETFYYEHSKQGKALAEIMQSHLKTRLDTNNQRSAKANSSYYLLKKTSNLMVIVECGYLSNREEAKLLSQRHYQERVAWAIHMGAMEYLNDNTPKKRK
jgi:N-acetylmuramoyl-L-alanine amidase